MTLIDFRRILPAAAVLLTAAARAADGGFTPAQLEFFESRVRPVLAENCYSCHGPDKQNNGLRLDSRAAVVKGSDYGPVTVPGDPDASRLIQAVRRQPGVEAMPKKGDALPPEQIAALEEWIRQGLPWPEESSAPPPEPGWKHHWAFQPVEAPPVPEVGDPSAVRQLLDAFVLHRLEEKGLTFSPPADRATLIRRAAFVLTGLMPTADELRAFADDPDPDAFAALVDRLLASPHFGERWARHWMDVARYSDTKGYVFQEERRYAYAWTYRDWLIDAFNRDLPYDRFLTLQLAADKVAGDGADPRDLAAMGFLTLGRRFLNNQADIIDDRIDVVFRGTQGLTVTCARCHDHKFDPIPTADYYSLYGVFASSEEPEEKPLIGEPEDSPESQAFRKELAELEAKVDGYRTERCRALFTAPELERLLAAVPEFAEREDGEFRKAARERDLNAPVLRLLVDRIRDAGESDPVFAMWHRLQRLPAEGFAEAAKAAVADPADDAVSHPVVLRTLRESPPDSPAAVAAAYARLLSAAPTEGPEWAAIAEVSQGENGLQSLSEERIESGFNRKEREHLNQLRAEVERFKATSPAAPPRAMVMVDREKPVEPVIFIRGNPSRRGPQVPRQFLEVISPQERKPFGDGSGRLELAHEIADARNPLTARVFVNRVWALTFGAPLVDTPGDFGVRTPPPDNPALLDAVAAEFMRDGWSVKRLLRRILLSTAWQQSSASRPDGVAADPENRTFWRQNRRRLEFESMRDNLLRAAGNLDLKIGGRSVDILSEPFSRRRALYGFIDRQNFPGLFRTFDRASPDNTTPLRYETTVPQQALFFLNSPFVIEQARSLADKSAGLAAENPEAAVAWLFRQVLERDPDPAESALALDTIRDLAGAPRQTGTSWENGYGRAAGDGHCGEFHPLPVWHENRWAGGPSLPDERLGWVTLTAGGGHPGSPGFAAIRRWTAPDAATLRIAGTVRVPSDKSGGIRATILRNDEVIGDWPVPGGGEVAAIVESVSVQAGDRLSFVADCDGDTNSDSFAWAPVIADAATHAAVASASDDFGGPGVTPWQAFAQVLLCSNEFLFVD